MRTPDLARIPAAPGVYRFVDATGRVLYVGKARRLSARLKSYFTGAHHPRTERMLAAAHDVVWVVCASEREALLLEREWIAGFQPPYNVLLRAGSGYAGVALSRGDVPRLFPWRGRRPAGAQVFGPFPGAGTRALMDALTRGFGVRSCSDREYARAAAAGRACLLGETGRCLAPCVQPDQVAPHADKARQLARFLQGGSAEQVAAMREQMTAFAAQENFEAAAALRDQVAALEGVGQQQRVLGPDGWQVDALALSREADVACVAVVRVRDGSVRDVLHFSMDDDPESDDITLLAQVAAQLVARGELLTPALCAQQVDDVTVQARRRRERELLDFTQTQAGEALAQAGTAAWAAGLGRESALAELVDVLALPRLPLVIECIDVSHTAGRQGVASLVRLRHGVPDPAGYRHVKVAEFAGDDFAAVAATVTRRVSGRRMGLPDLPDLLLIDGGPGQVAAAAAALEAAWDGPPEQAPALAGLAKRLEEVWLPAQDDPVVLSRTSDALRVLQIARDEAHKTAIGRHRRLRDRDAMRTLVDGVPGIGPSRQEQLRTRFGTLDAIAAASRDELASVLGETLGPRLWHALHGEDA